MKSDDVFLERLIALIISVEFCFLSRNPLVLIAEPVIHFILIWLFQLGCLILSQEREMPKFDAFILQQIP